MSDKTLIAIAMATALLTVAGVAVLASAFWLWVQPVSATPLVVYRLAFRSPRFFADVD